MPDARLSQRAFLLQPYSLLFKSHRHQLAKWKILLVKVINTYLCTHLEKMRAKRLMLVFAAALSLTACGQVSEAVSDLLRPPSAAEIGARVTNLAEKGQVDEALRKGEAFLAENADPGGHVHRALAQVYLERGDAQRAAQHLLQAPAPTASIKAGEALTPATAPTASGDATGRSTTADAAPPPAAAVQAVTAEVDGASARITSKGIEVRAGDASVTLPK